jgi:hypothetical protein
LLLLVLIFVVSSVFCNFKWDRQTYRMRQRNRRL